MSSHGSDLISNTRTPTSPVLNNWVSVMDKDGNQDIIVWTIYEYIKQRQLILIGENKYYSRVNLIFPKNPIDWLKINKLDERQKQSFKEHVLQVK